MSEELKVKFEEMIDSHQYPTPEDKAEIVSYCEAAYNLGKASEEATIENLASRVIELEGNQIGWTKCNDRLPSDGGEYNVSYIGINNQIYVTAAFFLIKLNKWDALNYNILAWQPLPKPPTHE